MPVQHVCPLMLCWMLVSCAVALRLPVGSPRQLWQQCVFQEPVAVLLHSTDLARSVRALGRVPRVRSWAYFAM